MSEINAASISAIASVTDFEEVAAAALPPVTQVKQLYVHHIDIKRNAEFLLMLSEEKQLTQIALDQVMKISLSCTPHPFENIDTACL